ncbi:hypothetical protein BU25DRAFT_416508 [Macroventuria anomochaeta]|uniref:Uncharacterized protein n=1 Tax=Macroventuria anomochaeta TaxID=301207 RepID=A0ACB6SGY5_9PLEO|nr:uncharacterized protein BU25DRAFT_416508 [Macroventuria anomochaeta]KAF2633258.1 hypothetical protein BU25DRAFT_416508 [Macroventuria anomochaeta]
MHVDAKDVPTSSIVAIVATLASVALLSFSLRLYTRGRLLRSRDTDDWLLLVAALCTVGVLVVTIVLTVEKRTWSTTAGGGHTVSLLVWVFGLIHIIGIGFIKLSVALTVLKVAGRSWHRHTILGYICLTTVLTVLWFSSALLFGGPITVNWSAASDPEATWKLLGFINSVLDLATSVLVALLPLPLLWILRPGLSVRLTLLFVYVLTTVAVAAATARAYFLHTVWQNTNVDNAIASIMLCSSIELTVGMLAACLFALQPLVSSISQCLSDRRASKQLSTSTGPSSHRYPSQTYASTDTVIHRPDAPHLLTLRFHDDESNLDFDIETPNTRTRTQTLRSRGTHSRNVSDWSQFSGFTYNTTTANSIHEASPRRSRVVSMNEMELRTRTIGVGRAGAENANIGIAVTTLHDKPVRDPEAGEEMAELARFFAHNSKDWGTEVSRSVRTSVTTEGTRASRHRPNYTGPGAG